MHIQRLLISSITVIFTVFLFFFMKVFIVGGTGFLGYHSALEFLKRGHSVTTMSIPDIQLGDWFPKEIKVVYGDVFKMNEDELIDTFKGYDVMVYSVGPDDRYVPPVPAYKFFHERLVVACTKVVVSARKAGVKKCVVLNSYFEYFDRIWPHKRLAERHPYIRARKEQAESVIEAGGDEMAVCVLNLPYIFGTMPERVPIWKDVFLERLKNMSPVIFPKGGTNMLSVEHVAEAVVGASERGKHGRRYIVGDENMDWKEMLGLMFNTMGMKKKILTAPVWLMSMVGRVMRRNELKKGNESGLDLRYLFKDIQSEYLYYDPSETIEELGMTRGGVRESIIETVKDCYPELQNDNIKPDTA